MMTRGGQFTSQSVIVEDATRKFGQSLQENRLHLRDYGREFGNFVRGREGMIKKLARQQVQMDRSLVMATGRTASGQMRAGVYTPTGLDAGMQTKAALARKELQVFNKVLQQGSTKLIDWGKNTQWAGRQLTVGLTVPLSIFATTAAKTFYQFDKELTRLGKVYGSDLGSSGEEAIRQIKSQVSDLAGELAKAYGIPVEQTLGLAADLAATGKEGNDLLVATAQTTRLAALGEVDRQEAMKTTLSIQSAFKSSNEELAESIDFLNAVENQTSASLQDLTAAIPRAGPVVKALGGDVKDLAAMLVAMREGGVPAAEGANAIKSSLASLIGPTQKAQDYLKSFGIDLVDIVDRNAGKLMPTLIEFQAKLEKLDDLSRARIIEQLFGKFQFARITALFNNLNKEGSQTREVFKLMEQDTAQLAANSQKELDAFAKSPSGMFKRAWEGVRADLGKVGEQFLNVATKALGVVDKIFNFFESLPDGLKKFLGGAGMFVALLGPIIMMTGTLGNFVGYVIKGIAFLRTFGRVGLTSFEYMTAESIAARGAGDLLEQSFYDQTTAARTFDSALQKLIMTMEGLGAEAMETAVEVDNAMQTAAGRTAAASTAMAGATSGASLSRVPRVALKQGYSYEPEGVHGTPSGSQSHWLPRIEESARYDQPARLTDIYGGSLESNKNHTVDLGSGTGQIPMRAATATGAGQLAYIEEWKARVQAGGVEAGKAFVQAIAKEFRASEGAMSQTLLKAVTERGPAIHQALEDAVATGMSDGSKRGAAEVYYSTVSAMEDSILTGGGKMSIDEARAQAAAGSLYVPAMNEYGATTNADKKMRSRKDIGQGIPVQAGNAYLQLDAGISPVDSRLLGLDYIRESDYVPDTRGAVLLGGAPNTAPQPISPPPETPWLYDVAAGPEPLQRPADRYRDFVDSSPEPQQSPTGWRARLKSRIMPKLDKWADGNALQIDGVDDLNDSQKRLAASNNELDDLNEEGIRQQKQGGGVARGVQSAGMVAGSIGMLGGGNNAMLQKVGEVGFGITMAGPLIEKFAENPAWKKIAANATGSAGKIGKMGTALSAVGPKLGAMASVAFGPWGLAIGAAAGALYMLNRRLQQARERTTSWTRISEESVTRVGGKWQDMTALVAENTEELERNKTAVENMVEAIGENPGEDLQNLIDDLKDDTFESALNKLRGRFYLQVSMGGDPEKVRAEAEALLQLAGREELMLPVRLELMDIEDTGFGDAVSRGMEETLNTYNSAGPGGLEGLVLEPWREDFTGGSDEAPSHALVGAWNWVRAQATRDRSDPMAPLNDLMDDILSKRDEKNLPYVVDVDAAKKDISELVRAGVDLEEAIRRVAGIKIDPAESKEISLLVNNLKEVKLSREDATTLFTNTSQQFATALSMGSDAVAEWGDAVLSAPGVDQLHLGEIKAAAIELYPSLGELYKDAINDANDLAEVNVIVALGLRNVGLAVRDTAAEQSAARQAQAEWLAKDIYEYSDGPKVKISGESGPSSQEKKEPGKFEFKDPYEKQKELIEEKIEAQKEEIEKIREKADAEKKAFDKQKRYEDFYKKMRASQIGYREALAAGDFGQAALIKNEMAGDKEDFDRENKESDAEDRADAAVKARENEIKSLEKQLDALEKLSEAAEDAARKRYDKMVEASKTAQKKIQKENAVTQDELDTVSQEVFDKIKDRTITSSEDMSKLTQKQKDTIIDAGYSLDQFYEIVNDDVYEWWTAKNKETRALANSLFDAGMSLMEVMDMLALVDFMGSQGFNIGQVAPLIKNEKITPTKSSTGEIVGYTFVGVSNSPRAQDEASRRYLNNWGAGGYGGGDLPGPTNGPLGTGFKSSMNNYPKYNTRSGFTAKYDGNHAGLDFAAPVGTPIYAARGGKVVTSKNGSTGFGNYVVLESGGIQFAYGHMARRSVQVGQKAGEGTMLGTVGMSGNTSGPHVHYEVRPKGTGWGNANWQTALDPRKYMHTGGLVSGPGMGGLKSDEMIRVLQAGEFVMQKSAVAAYGADTMAAINQGRVASGAGNMYNLNVYPSPGMDVDGFVNKVVRKLDEKEKRKGGKRN
jgi:TP901 family phage tail tape measure protein